ncbi:MAG: hypothetical protein AAFP70_19960, partial [Calditrichota bacterium]
EAKFDILLTIDKNIDSQQNIENYSIALVIFDVFRSNIRYFEPLLPEFKAQLDSCEKGNVYILTEPI